MRDRNRQHMRGWRRSPALWDKLKPEVKRMRRNPTPSEAKLWERLKGRRFLGKKFRRQHAVDRFIVDFYCDEARLVIELDGPIHESSVEQDSMRDELLKTRGMKILRFRNDEVMQSIDAVLEKIALELQ